MQFRAAARSAQDAQRVALGLALAYLGRKEEAIREGERGVALDPVSKDAARGPSIQHQLVRIYMLVGEPERALDELEPLLKSRFGRYSCRNATIGSTFVARRAGM